MLPTDPSPYRTIASALAAARADRAPTQSTPRSRAALRDYVQRQRASDASQAARDARVQSACDNRFRDKHDDYATSHPYVAPGFTTKR